MKTAVRFAHGGVVLLAALAFLAISASSGAVHAQGPLAFGLRPADTGGITRAYFTYTLQPGADVQDEAVVVNSGQQAI